MPGPGKHSQNGSSCGGYRAHRSWLLFINATQTALSKTLAESFASQMCSVLLLAPLTLYQQCSLGHRGRQEVWQYATVSPVGPRGSQCGACGCRLAPCPPDVRLLWVLG